MAQRVSIGSFIKVKTKTLEDKFGECVYKIIGPEVEVEELGKKVKKVKCVMLGGTGEAARSGMPIWDTFENIERNIDEGITQVIPEDQAKQIEQECMSKSLEKFDMPHGGKGCMEVNL